MKLIRFLLFNGVTKMTVKSVPGSFPGNKRLMVVLIELQNLTAILMLPMVFSMILVISLQYAKVIVSEQVAAIFWSIQLSAISTFVLNKDLWGGQSIVHRALGYQVVNAITGEPASKIRCFIRNITFPVWIIEIIPLMVTPQRRIGDRIAGTKLIRVPPSDPTRIVDEIKQTRWTDDLKWTLLLSFIFTAANVAYFTHYI